MSTPIGKQIQLPLSQAMAIAWRSLRVRVARSVLTLITIAMAIAFLTDVLMLRVWAPAAAGASAPRTVWLLALSLLVCVVGISNAMLMSVMERFREIGTMKCLGALDSFILRLFFFESIFLGAAGSLIGATLGIGLALAQALLKSHAAFTPHPLRNALLVAALGVALGTAMTAAAAAYPSWKAARMEPVEAMRVEV